MDFRIYKFYKVNNNILGCEYSKVRIRDHAETKMPYPQSKVGIELRF